MRGRGFGGEQIISNQLNITGWFKRIGQGGEKWKDGRAIRGLAAAVGNISLVGIVTEKEKGQFRLIHHVSWPEGQSANDL